MIISKQLHEYDRLSSLTDDTILHILSFLPTKTFVQTSSLAKRWRFLWTDLPFSAFTCNGHVNKLCRLRDSSNTFHICDYSSNPRTDSKLESWIATIFSRNVRNLLLGSKTLTLPRCLFSCTTLVDLIILNCEYPPQNFTPHFPALKSLELANIGWGSAKFMSNLISGCPVIEELTVRTPLMAECCVSLPTLTRLFINTNLVSFIKLDCPKLKYLRLRAHETLAHPGPFMVDISASSLSLDDVVEATVDLNRGRIVLSNHALVGFVGKMCNVQRLTLFTGQMKIPDYEFMSLTTKLYMLAELVLGADWRFITKFIENANNLRQLVIFRMDYHSKQHWIEPKPGSFMLRLEVVRLYNFEWSTNNEFDMIKYILKNATALRTISIIYTSKCKSDWREKVQVLNKLASFEMPSPSVLFKLFYLQT